MDIRHSESLDFLLSDSYYIQERSNTLLSSLEELQHDIHTSSRISSSSNIGRVMADTTSMTTIDPNTTNDGSTTAADVTFDGVDMNVKNGDMTPYNNDTNDDDKNENSKNDTATTFIPVLICENDDDIMLISPKATTNTSSIQEIVSIDSPKLHESVTATTSSVEPEIVASPTSKKSNGAHIKSVVTDGISSITPPTTNLRGPAPTKKMMQQQQSKNALQHSKVTTSGSSTPSPKNASTMGISKASSPPRTSLSSPRKTTTMTTKTTTTGKNVTQSHIRPKISSPTASIVNAKSSPPLKNASTRKPVSRTKSSPHATSVKRSVTPGRSKSVEKLRTSSLPRVALMSSNKPKLKETTAVEKGGWTPLPPVRKSKVIFTIPSAKASGTAASSNIENRTTTPSRPAPTKGTTKMNPVLAERRANAAATSVTTPYKVSVTNAVINKKKINVKTKPLQLQHRTIQSLNKQFDASSSPTAVSSMKMKKQNTSTTSVTQSTIDTRDFPRSNEWNNAMKCQKADKSYSKKLYMAFTKGTVMVMSSFLSKEEEMALQTLVTKTKSHSVKLLISDTFQRQKTSICVLPVAETVSVPASESVPIVNTIADRRSMKAMEAMLHGIPIVTPEWISACMKEEKVILPTSSMFVRSLPSKSLVVEGTNDDNDNNQNNNPTATTTLSDFGIAFLSAAMDTTSGKYKPLAGVVEFVYLTGFSARKQGELSALVRDAGAKEVITKSLIAVEPIKQLSNNSASGAFVFLCNDTNVTFSQDLEQSMKQYQKSKTPRSTGSIWIVDSNWLYDSITCGEALLSDASRSNPNYKPVGGKGLELWNAIMPISTTGSSNVDNTTISPTNGATTQQPQHIKDDSNDDTPTDTAANVATTPTNVEPVLDTSSETISENTAAMDDTTSEQHETKPTVFV